MRYISKYVSKTEKSSTSYMQLKEQILPYTNTRLPLLSFASKLLNKLVSERDYSAQEVSHFLLGLPVSHYSRQVVTIDCRPESKRSYSVTVSNHEIVSAKSTLQRYQDRLESKPELASLTLIPWL